MGDESSLERSDPLLGPRLDLGATGTPLERADRLRAVLGRDCPTLWLKRDDFQPIAFGGNKLRKLELLLHDARSAGATAVGTVGGPTSNHLRLTAAAALRVGLSPHAYVLGDPSPAQGGNLRLLELLGVAPVGISAEGGVRDQVARARAHFETNVTEAGGRGFWIDLGGASLRGDLSYVGCAREIAADLAARGRRPAALYAAVGTGGTCAGLAVGCALFCPDAEVVGYAVNAKGTQVFAGLPSVNGQIARLRQHLQAPEARFRLLHTEVGAGYAVPTASAKEAIELLARTEGSFLDPVYTGKAMAGLLGELRAGRFRPEDDVVFIHTGGGPGLFFRAS
jgi:1-aminocyclopropane-1-carboxylate deaminase/D-cysteine desulfhydrase-like pyridoxal-dependent ACC family enzyme